MPVVIPFQKIKEGKKMPLVIGWGCIEYGRPPPYKVLECFKGLGMGKANKGME